MKIAVFTNAFPSRVSTFFARDIRSLIDAGLEVEVFAIRPLDSQLWRFVPSMLGEDILPRNRVHHAGLQSVLLGAKALLSNRAVLAETLRMAKDSYRFGGVQLLKTLMAVLKGAYWAEWAATRFDYALAYWGNYSATSAYVFHKLSAGSMGFGTFLHAGTDLYRDQIYLKEKLQAADNIVVVCDFNREYVRSLYPDVYGELAPKIVIHHPGLDLRSFSFSKREKDPNLVISVGGFSRAKGFDILLKALRILRDGGCPATVDLVGDGEEAQHLKELAGTLGISEYVRFRGWLTPSDVQDAISNATLLVHPSNGLGDAVPTVIKEAMTLGVPVVASYVAGIPELLDNGACGTLVKPGDEAELAAAICRMLGNAPLRVQHATLARERAEQLFDAERNGLRLASVLRGRHSATSPAADISSMRPLPSNT